MCAEEDQNSSLVYFSYESKAESKGRAVKIRIWIWYWYLGSCSKWYTVDAKDASLDTLCSHKMISTLLRQREIYIVDVNINCVNNCCCAAAGLGYARFLN